MTNYLYKCGNCQIVRASQAYVGGHVSIGCVVCKDVTLHYNLVVLEGSVQCPSEGAVFDKD